MRQKPKRSTIHRAVTLASLAFALATLCQADVFTTLPTDGAITVSPLETVGWGYSIQNQTANYLLPIGLSNSGVLLGALFDIFDYPVVDPGQTAFQAYAFNAPGGFGNSLGLFEYTAPADLPIGLDQTGTFMLTYQFYNANPDLDPNASPVGDPVTATVNFDLKAVETSAVPEPGSVTLLSSALIAFLSLRRWSVARKRATGRTPNT